MINLTKNEIFLIFISLLNKTNNIIVIKQIKNKTFKNNK